MGGIGGIAGFSMAAAQRLPPWAWALPAAGFSALQSAPAAALILLGFAAWGCVSEQLPGSETNRRYACLLLLAGGALLTPAKALKVRPLARAGSGLRAYALGALAGAEQHRSLAGSTWLSLLYAGAEPVERSLQRWAAADLHDLDFPHPAKPE